MMSRSLRRALVWWRNAPGDGESIPRRHHNVLTKAGSIEYCEYHESVELTCKGRRDLEDLEFPKQT